MKIKVRCARRWGGGIMRMGTNDIIIVELGYYDQGSEGEWGKWHRDGAWMHGCLIKLGF